MAEVVARTRSGRAVYIPNGLTDEQRDKLAEAQEAREAYLKGKGKEKPGE